MPNAQASSSIQQANPRHKPLTEGRSESQAGCASQQATPRHKPPTEERKKEKTAKKIKTKESRQERSDDTSQSGTKRKIPPTMANVPWFDAEDNDEEEKTGATSQEPQEPKDSWEDTSDNEELMSQEHFPCLKPKPTDEEPPVQHEEKQHDKITLLTRVARADKAIMKALIKIATSTGQNEEVAAQIDNVLSEHSKLKKIIIEQGQEIAFQRGRISELEKRATQNKEREEKEQAMALQPPVMVE